MPSPQYQDFVLQDSSTGALVVAQTIGNPGIHFLAYTDETGAALSQPTIVNLGNGHYGFIPVFTTSHNILYSITCGSGVMPASVSGFIRPEDYNTDSLDISSLSDRVDQVLDNFEGKWQIFTTGIYANSMVVYKRNGDILKIFALTDKNGNPTTVNPYTRNPTGP